MAQNKFCTDFLSAELRAERLCLLQHIIVETPLPRDEAFVEVFKAKAAFQSASRSWDRLETRNMEQHHSFNIITRYLNAVPIYNKAASSSRKTIISSLAASPERALALKEKLRREALAGRRACDL